MGMVMVDGGWRWRRFGCAVTDSLRCAKDVILDQTSRIGGVADVGQEQGPRDANDQVGPLVMRSYAVTDAARRMARVKWAECRGVGCRVEPGLRDPGRNSL